MPADLLARLQQDASYFRLSELAQLAQLELDARLAAPVPWSAPVVNGSAEVAAGSGATAGNRSSSVDPHAASSGSALLSHIKRLSSVAVPLNASLVEQAKAVLLQGMTRFNSSYSIVCTRTSTKLIYDPVTGAPSTIDTCDQVSTQATLGHQLCEKEAGARCLCIESQESIPDSTCNFNFTLSPSNNNRSGPYNGSCIINSTVLSVNPPLRLPLAFYTRGVPSFYMCKSVAGKQYRFQYYNYYNYRSYSYDIFNISFLEGSLATSAVNFSLTIPIATYGSLSELVSYFKLPNVATEHYARGWLLQLLKSRAVYDTASDSFTVSSPLNYPGVYSWVPVSPVDESRRPLFRGPLDASSMVYCGHPDLYSKGYTPWLWDERYSYSLNFTLTASVCYKVDPMQRMAGDWYSVGAPVFPGAFLLPANPGPSQTETVPYPYLPFSSRVLNVLTDRYGAWLEGQLPGGALKVPRMGVLRFINDGVFFGADNYTAPILPVS